MGDVHVCRPRATGPLGGEHSSALASQPPNPRPSEVSTENWRLSERAMEKVIRQIQPTGRADRRRREVVEYVRGMIKAVADAEIFPFGSVPLKTYLPDGDIDLTAIETPRSDDNLARDVLAVLQAEEQNNNSEFEVKDVQYIHAEVRLVKCLVDNIVVDISFQQIGGLCTLCFLEKVDRMIGKNHLFKRSILLIKAWCYYESRILGAHHGLISTYALETLVLYIFHVFHSSLDGPLAVLYRFLDYFGTFKWDKYCVSLNGPVCLSSLPEIVAESPENDGGDLLLSKDFLKSCENAFTSVFKWSDNSSTSRSFHQKHLNIIDPLKANNNLGRSVSKGNFYRIRSAFQFGARKLGSILTLPGERITDALNEFFKNVLERHDIRERPDGGDSISSDSLPSISGDSVPYLWAFGTEKDIDSTTSLSPPINFHGGLFEDINNLRISGMVTEPLMQTELCSQPSCETYLHRFSDAQSSSLAEGKGILDIRRAGDAKDTSEGTGPRDITSTCKPLSSRNGVGNSAPLKIHHAPHLFFCKENGNVSFHELEPKKVLSVPFQSKGMSVSTDNIPGSEVCKDMAPSNCCPASPGRSDLTGDYDTHMKNLLYAMGCLDRQPPPLFYNQLHQDPLYQLNMFTHMNANGMVPGPFPTGSYYPLGATFIPGTFSLDELPRTRGTGTYFPNANHWSYLERRSPGRGRNHASGSQLSRSRNNGRASTTVDKALADKGSHESTSHAQGHHPNGSVHLRPGQLEANQVSCSSSRGFLQANGLASPPDNGLEFGTFGCVKVAVSPSEPRRNVDAHAPHSQTSGATEPPPAAQKQGAGSTDERPRRTYHLRNEEDFPPLRGLVHMNR